MAQILTVGFVYFDGLKYTIQPGGAVGPAGPQGPQGNTGATGAQGPAGPQGPPAGSVTWTLVNNGSGDPVLSQIAEQWILIDNASTSPITVTFPAMPNDGDIVSFKVQQTSNAGAYTTVSIIPNTGQSADDPTHVGQSVSHPTAIILATSNSGLASSTFPEGNSLAAYYKYSSAFTSWFLVSAADVGVPIWTVVNSTSPSPQQINANDIVFVDSTGGAIEIAVPAAPNARDEFSIDWVDGYGINTLTLTGSAMLESPNFPPGTFLSLPEAVNTPGYYTWTYNPNGNWSLKTRPGSSSVVLGGDVTGPTSANELTSIQGIPVSAVSPTSGFVLTYNGTAWVPQAITTGSVTLLGDVTGVATANKVSAISGISPINITPNVLNWLSTSTAPTLSQINVSTASATGKTFTIQAQNATGTTSTGGNLVLTSGTGTSTKGTTIIEAGGVAVGYFGPSQLSSGGNGVFELAQVITSPTSLPSSGISFYAGSTQLLGISGTGITFNPNVAHAIAINQGSLNNNAGASGTAGQTFNILAQNGQATTFASGAGGAGGLADFIGGTGGTSATGIGGAGGAAIIQSGIGGAATTGSGNGGNGGDLRIIANLGGASSGGLQGTGGTIRLCASINGATPSDQLTIGPNGVNTQATFNTTTITFSNYGLGIIHSSAGGLLTSSNIVNADVDPAAAVVVSKLAAGTSAQVLVTNVATPTWTTISGDTSINATGVVTVKGLQGNPVSATAPTTGYVLTWSGSLWTPQAVSISSITLSGDVTGASNANKVSAISGISPIDITPAAFTWLSTAAAPILSQATTSATSGKTFTIQAQNATGALHHGGSLVLSAGTSDSSTGGDITLNSVNQFFDATGNVEFFGNTGDFGGGTGIILIDMAGVNPTSNPDVPNFFLWSNGATFNSGIAGLQAQGSFGAITTLASMGSDTSNTQTQGIDQFFGTVRTTTTTDAHLIAQYGTPTGTGGTMEISLLSRAITTAVGLADAGDTCSSTWVLTWSNVGGTVKLAYNPGSGGPGPYQRLMERTTTVLDSIVSSTVSVEINNQLTATVSTNIISFFVTMGLGEGSPDITVDSQMHAMVHII